MSMRGGRGLFYIYSLTHSLVSVIYPHSIIYTHSLTHSLTRLTHPTYSPDEYIWHLLSWQWCPLYVYDRIVETRSIYNTNTKKRVIESRAQMYNVVCGQQTWQTRTEGRIDGLHDRQVMLHSGRWSQTGCWETLRLAKANRPKGVLMRTSGVEDGGWGLGGAWSPSWGWQWWA